MLNCQIDPCLPPCRAPGPSGEWLEQPTERPHSVNVRMLSSSTAAVTWAPSTESHNGSLVSVLSLTCLKPSLSQRTENTYCSEVSLLHHVQYNISG